MVGYIVMLRVRIFRSLIIRTGIKERNGQFQNIKINLLYSLVVSIYLCVSCMRTIGDHMKETGLVDSWVKSGLLGPNICY